MSEKERFKVYIAVHVFLRDGDKILMHRRKNSGFEDGNYGVIQGHLEGKETSEMAAVREAKEEANIDIDLSDIKVVHVMHWVGDLEYINTFVEVQKWNGTPQNMEPDRCEDVTWFSVNDLPQNTIPYIRQAIEMSAAGKFYSTWGWEKLDN